MTLKDSFQTKPFYNILQSLLHRKQWKVGHLQQFISNCICIVTGLDNYLISSVFFLSEKNLRSEGSIGEWKVKKQVLH